MTIINALTIDVEDYFQVSAFAKNIRPADWDDFPSRVEENTRRILDTLAEFDTRATFFILGWVAERFPALVKDIASRGHEVASHGYAHQLIYDQTPDEFRNETRTSKDLLENLIGKPILGYRAASFSITRKSIWALQILKDVGFEYDTSIFPVRHDRYGLPAAHRFPHCLRLSDQTSLIEFPMSTALIGKFRIPVSGGGYFRLLPYWWTRFFLSRINSADNQPFMFYFHPWEIDPGQPRVHNIPLLSRIRHYTNIAICEERLRRLLAEFKFSTVQDVLAVNGSRLLHYDVLDVLSGAKFDGFRG